MCVVMCVGFAAEYHMCLNVCVFVCVELVWSGSQTMLRSKKHKKCAGKHMIGAFFASRLVFVQFWHNIVQGD